VLVLTNKIVKRYLGNMIKMFKLSHIKPFEIIRVRTEGDDGIEEPCLAKVLSNEGTYLLVTYFNYTSKVYRDTTVYMLDSQAQRVDMESIMEWFEDTTNFEDIGFKPIGKNMYAETKKINCDEDMDSEIEDFSDEEEDDESLASDDSLRDFIVPDDDSDVEQTEVDEELERDWDNWKPTGRNEKRFKSVVDAIEEKYASKSKE